MLQPTHRLAIRARLSGSAAAGIGVLSGWAGADPLNPLEFPVLPPVSLASGLYTVDTDGLTISQGTTTLCSGTCHGNAIAVFCFESLEVQALACLEIAGRRPVAFLAVGDIRLAGDIIGVGQPGMPHPMGMPPGAGGLGMGGGGDGGVFNHSTSSNGGVGPRGGGMGGGDGGQPGYSGYAGGGGFGGAGGDGWINVARGGRVYGDLLRQLQGGSGGGGAAVSVAQVPSGGGAGGAGVELGCLGTLTITGGIEVQGGVIANGGGRGGAGSGGGLLLHAPAIIGGGYAIADGGYNERGAGGGGGQIVVQTGSAPAVLECSASGGDGVNYGSYGLNGSDGVIQFVRASLFTRELNFGDVAVGTQASGWLIVENSGDPQSSVNGRFPATSGVFSGGERVFSGLRDGRPAVSEYIFRPPDIGTFSQSVSIVSDAGVFATVLRGRGVPSCLADFNLSGTISVQDIFDFLAAYFAGCP